MTTLQRILGTREFTGWHMAGVMVLFFGTITSVNLTLAWFANSSWSGLVVKNSYVESQRFNAVTAERLRSAKLGWRVASTYADGSLTLQITGSSGEAASAGELSASIGKPATGSEDRNVEFTPLGGGRYAVPTLLTPGLWQAELKANAPDGTPFRHTIRFTVEDR